MKRIKLTEAEKQKLKDSGVDLMYLYGSAVSGCRGVEPDLDVGVMLRPEIPPSLDKYSELYAVCSDFGHFSEHELDLVLLEKAEMPLQLEVATRGVLLYERKRGMATDELHKIIQDNLSDLEGFCGHIKKVLQSPGDYDLAVD